MLSTIIPRLAAEHFCPAWPNADCTRSFTAASISAHAVITSAFLPLVSASKFKSLRHCTNILAVSNAPVRMSALISGCVIKYLPFSSSRLGINCSASYGIPASHICCASSHAVATVSGAGLKRTGLPAASAAKRPPAGIAYGKFHGGTTRTVPIGVLFSSSIVEA